MKVIRQYETYTQALFTQTRLWQYVQHTAQLACELGIALASCDRPLVRRP